MLKILLSTLCIVISLSTRIFAQISKVDSSEMITLRIDPKSIRGATVSQTFDEVNFIPLETTKESLFGSITKIELAGDCFVIYDRDTRAVLVFGKDGKFKAKLNGSKIKEDKSEQTGSDVSGFSLKHEINRSLIRIYSGKYYYYFDLNGKLVNRVIAIDETYDWGIRFKDGTEVIDSYDRNGDRYNLALIKDTSIVEAYFPYTNERFKDDYFSVGINPISDSKIPNEMYFVNYFDYNIYRITPKKLFLSYRIVFPSEISFPSDFTSNPVYVNKRHEFFKQQPNKISEISNVYRIGNKLFFKVYSLANKQRRNGFIYNLTTRSSVSIKDLEPDQLSMFLPVTDMAGFTDFDYKGFHLCDGTYLYTSYSSLAMFTYKEQSVNKNPNYTAAMKNYFKTQDRKSNPVIIQLKPKKG